MRSSTTAVDDFEEPTPDQAPDRLTREQANDCAMLLAFCIADYRTKYGVATFEQAVSKYRAAKDGADSKVALSQGIQVLKEALKLIEDVPPPQGPPLPAQDPPPPARNPPAQTTTQKVKLSEKRQQVRINVSAPVYVLPPKATTPLRAKLVNISWGGASFETDQPIGEVGEFIGIVLPKFQGRQITLQAEILRIGNGSDTTGYGVRFSKLRTADEELLQRLLEFLVESGDDTGLREHTRLTQRVDIQYDDAGEFQAMLEDISAGGLGITVPEPMELNQSLLAAISTTDEKFKLLLRVRVVRQQELDFSNITMYRVGLEFEHATEDVKKRVNTLLRQMATGHSTAQFQLSEA